MATKNGNGDTRLLVLEATSYQTKIFKSNLFAKLHMQKHQEANFRTAEYVCVQQ